LADVITLDFINAGLEPGARAGIELTLESARELRAALDRAIAAADFEESEVRGKSAAPASVRPREPAALQCARWSARNPGRSNPTPARLDAANRA
jgi:hypothetical protein